MTVLKTFGQGQKTRALCRCDCGIEFETSLHSVRYSRTKSCGCLRRRTTAMCGRSNRTHGHWVGNKESRTHISWSRMKARCYQPSYQHFASYGGRGIRVCDRWLKSFENFLADMGVRPPDKTLDRIDPNGNYEPDNCRWATVEQQAQNKRRNHAAIL